jgi:hypothetical protein
MTLVPPAPLRGLALLAALAAVAAGCAKDAAPVSRNRVYYADQQGGATVCTVAKDVALTAGRQTETTMTVRNDGGWCGIPVSQPGPKPYDAGLLVERPQHGRVHVRKVGDITRVDYIPDAGYGGNDAFTVRVLPGNAALRVAVTVQPGPATAAAAATPPAATPASAPASSASRRR